MASKFLWCIIPESMIICFHGLSIKTLAWAFFLFAIVCFIITYLHVIVLLEMGPLDPLSDSQYDYIDFPNIGPRKAQGENLLKSRVHSVNDIKLEEEASEGFNVIKTKILDSHQVELRGWWMPDVRWNAQIDCKSGLSNICRKVLSVACEPNNMRSIYQFLPINPSLRVTTVYFSASSKAPNLKPAEKKDPETPSIYSAIAYLKFKDTTYDYIRLDFSPGSHSEIFKQEERVLQHSQDLQSITVMLGCRGFQGTIHYGDIKVVPFVGGNFPTVNHIADLSCLPTRIPTLLKKGDYEIESLLQENESRERPVILTLVTQTRMDHLQDIQVLLGGWKEPVSAAVFIPGGIESDDQKTDWKNLYLRKKLSKMKFPIYSSFYSVKAITQYGEYNTNFMRNLALSKAHSEYVFLMDAEFLPSPGLKDEFQNILSYFQDKNIGSDKTAFVVPAFEMLRDVALPSTKDELKNLLTGEDPAILSYKWISSQDAHRSTNYRQWLLAHEPYPVLVYQDRYEPFIILKKSDLMPSFDERFPTSPFDRVSYTMELFAAGFTFMVLPNAWTIRPLSHSTNVPEPLGMFHQTEQYITRFEFVADLTRNYKLGSCAVLYQEKEELLD